MTTYTTVDIAKREINSEMIRLSYRLNEKFALRFTQGELIEWIGNDTAVSGMGFDEEGKEECWVLRRGDSEPQWMGGQEWSMPDGFSFRVDFQDLGCRYPIEKRSFSGVEASDLGSGLEYEQIEKQMKLPFFPWVDRWDQRFAPLDTEGLSLYRYHQITKVPYAEILKSYTVWNHRVRSNTLEGGDKEEIFAILEEPAGIDPLLNEPFSRFVKGVGGVPADSLEPIGISDLSLLQKGSPVFPIGLVPTEFLWSLGVFPQSAIRYRNRFRLYSKFKVEFCFPYGCSIENTGLDLEVLSFPDIKVRLLTKEEGILIDEVTLKKVDWTGNYFLNNTAVIQSGELRTINGYWDLHRRGENDWDYRDSWEWAVPDFSGDRIVEIEVEQGEAEIIINDQAGRTLWRHARIPVEAFTERQEVDLLNYPAKEESGVFFWHYRIDDSHNPSEDSYSSFESLITKLDLRQGILDASSFDELENTIFTYSPLDKSLFFESFSTADFFHGVAGNYYYRLFDIPRNPIQSLGHLQHLSVWEYPSYAIGNPSGGDLNAVFDRYYIAFSNGLKDDTHPAFNVHSRNKRAWFDVLRSSFFNEWEGQDKDQNKIIYQPSGTLFFRLPSNAQIGLAPAFSSEIFPFQAASSYPELGEMQRQEVFSQMDEDLSDAKSWYSSYRTGFRELTDRQVEDLAGVMVELLKDQSFSSLKEWVSSGILQKAIDLTDINTLVPKQAYLSSPSKQRIPYGAPQFLLQSDLLQALAPHISVRSDTFRAKITFKRGQQDNVFWVIFQRVPEYILNWNPSVDAPPHYRKVRILSIYKE